MVEIECPAHGADEVTTDEDGDATCVRCVDLDNYSGGTDPRIYFGACGVVGCLRCT